jgi:hypothetical protein
MAANSSPKSRQKNSRSAGEAKTKKDNAYPDIIEEPIRVVGNPPRGESKTDKSGKRLAKSSGKKAARKKRR